MGAYAARRPTIVCDLYMTSERSQLEKRSSALTVAGSGRAILVKARNPRFAQASRPLAFSIDISPSSLGAPRLGGRRWLLEHRRHLPMMVRHALVRVADAKRGPLGLWAR